ncbi:uncharacterized protein LOC121834734 [Ixodes scapularis]|uniref:uncharacterized protein LOC121834734 n=1 Tax=Ixodes scapularis TaxID=6945 RepID=UPI001C380323|nr:uncharacterized protein LOC121834734 [Ixodes scapularis]
MDRVLREVDHFALPYLEDIAIFLDSWEEHLNHIREVLTRLRHAGLTIPCDKKCHLAQHEKTAGHQANAKRHVPSLSRQSFLRENLTDGKKNAFYADLCEALVAANILWTKVENPVFKTFLQKYSSHTVPSESTLCKNYLQPMFEETLKKIRDELEDSCIWVSVDETTDATGRFVAHIMVGKLIADERTTPFLVCCKTLERTNGETVAYFVNTSLKVLYPTGVEDSRVLL